MKPEEDNKRIYESPLKAEAGIKIDAATHEEEKVDTTTKKEVTGLNNVDARLSMFASHVFFWCEVRILCRCAFQ